MKKILIIDYDQSSLASLHGILAKEGYHIVTATDGQAGWDKYNKESPDLVLMEAMLPKVHGFELCQRITSERNSQATVFIMTGVYKDRVYRTEALRTYGAAEYFEKPLKMAELLASVEAVLGKPEPRPEPAPEPEPVEAPVAAAAAPAPERAREPKAVPAPPRKKDKARSDDDLFALPADLDRLSKEIPKVKVPAMVRHDAPPAAKFEALADELLKSVVKEAAAPRAAVEPKPVNGNGNGNGNGQGKAGADIDTFLKSALAGFDLDKEKVKAPKPVPAPAPAPVVEKPKPVPPAAPAAAAKPKPAAEPEPAPKPATPSAKPAVEPASRNTLTPGDPGSDISPFFTPGKPKPEAPAERSRPAVKPAAPAPAPKAASKPAERPEPKPVPAEKEAAVIAATSLFGDVTEAKSRRGPSPLLLAVAGVAVLAAAGFFILKPKKAAEPEPGLMAPQTVVQKAEPEPAPVEEAPAPKPEPAPAKPKPKPQAKKEEPAAVGLEAVTPASITPPAPAPQTSALAGDAARTAATADDKAVPPAVPPAANAQEPPASTDPGSGDGAPATGAAGAPAETPAAPPVKEGDLIELGAVTELPQIVKSVDPVYPSAAQRLGVGGSITVNALIDEKGSVIDTAILRGIKDDPGLARAAENAVKKWKFQPARKNGVAVKVWKSFVISFKAANAPAGGRAASAI